MAIDAHKGRDVATIDIETTFLHIEKDKEIIMKLRGKMVELVVQLEPSMYQKYVTTGSNGEPILYLNLLKKLYGLLRSALVFTRSEGRTLEMWVLKYPVRPLCN